MKNVALIRIFIAFPLIGISLPDAAFIFDDVDYQIPTAHFVIVATLLIILASTYLFKPGKTGDNENLVNPSK